MNLAENIPRDPVAAANAMRTGFGLANSSAVLTLDGRGQIHDCNASGEALFECDRDDLVSRHIATLVPALANTDLIVDGQPNPSLRFYCRIGYQFEAVRRNGERFVSELSLNLIDRRGDGRLTLIVRPTSPEV